MNYYTIGQIHKLGLLKNYRGESYKDKATVSRAVGKMKWTYKKTPWGVSKIVGKDQIDKWNARNVDLADTILKATQAIKN